jgi:DNA-directed RNA polymerase subunit RPC12/RpoP
MSDRYGLIEGCLFKDVLTAVLRFSPHVEDATNAPRSPEDGTACVRCARETRVKAALSVEAVVYLRCGECGSVWSIKERRDRLKKRPDPAA